MKRRGKFSMQRNQHVQRTSSKENWPGVKCDFSNSSSFIHWLFTSGQVSLAFWPGLRGDNRICRQGLLSVRVIGAHPWCHFPVGDSHSCFSHDCPGVRTRCFSFGNLFSCVACSPGPQRLFLTILAKMFWGSWNLVLRKDLTILTVHLKVSQQWMIIGTWELASQTLCLYYQWRPAEAAPYGWFTERGD